MSEDKNTKITISAPQLKGSVLCRKIPKKINKEFKEKVKKIARKHGLRVDFIVKISGQNDKVKAVFEEIEQRAKDLEIKVVSLKLKRDKVKIIPSTDVLTLVAGNEKKVEEFLAEVSEIAVNQFKLNPVSNKLLLTDAGNDE